MNGINTVSLSGNLTITPELRQTPSGTEVCNLRLAVNESVKDAGTGEWRDRPNYVTVDVFGGQAGACAKYLAKGSAVAVSGRLRWREWEAQDGGKREALTVVAERVVFMSKREATVESEAVAKLGAVKVSDPDDDIPF